MTPSARSGPSSRHPASERANAGRALVPGYRSRRASPASAEGRWSVLETRVKEAPTPTEWSTSVAQQLLARYGLVTRAVATSEGLVGGFGAVYDVFKALEASGRIRRGYFVSGVGATQFVLPPVVDLLRSLRTPSEPPEVVLLAATDPANPYGALLPWSEPGSRGDGPCRPGRGRARRSSRRRPGGVDWARRTPSLGVASGR